MRISDWSSDVCSSDLTWAWIVSGWWLWRRGGPGTRGRRQTAMDCGVDGSSSLKTGWLLRGCGESAVWCRVTSCWCKRRSEEHTSELQSLMRISYAVFCLKKKNMQTKHQRQHSQRTMTK